MKGAIAIAQEYAGGAGAKIRGDDVESAIAVHIAQGHGSWTSSRVDGGLSCKRRQGGNGWQSDQIQT
ncbi:MAG: hypothetical protein WCP68_12465, partial [Enhydrobacter sp.]